MQADLAKYKAKEELRKEMQEQSESGADRDVKMVSFRVCVARAPLLVC